MYEKLGKAQGPSVLGKVFLAFLTPIFVFIVSLAGANKLLDNHLSDKARTLAGFLLALMITLLVVFFIRAIRRPGNDQPIDQCKQR